MSVKLYKFRDLAEANLFLSGAVIGGADISGGVVGLVGKTLNFTTPSGAVTFTAVASRPNGALLIKDIKSQVETAIVALKVAALPGGRIVFVEASPTTGVSIPATDQEAKGLLGFDQNTAFAGKVYGTDVTTPPAIGNIAIGQDGMILLALVE